MTWHTYSGKIEPMSGLEKLLNKVENTRLVLNDLLLLLLLVLVGSSAERLRNRLVQLEHGLVVEVRVLSLLVFVVVVVFVVRFQSRVAKHFLQCALQLRIDLVYLFIFLVIRLVFVLFFLLFVFSLSLLCSIAVRCCCFFSSWCGA